MKNVMKASNFLRAQSSDLCEEKRPTNAFSCRRNAPVFPSLIASATLMHRGLLPPMLSSCAKHLASAALNLPVSRVRRLWSAPPGCTLCFLKEGSTEQETADITCWAALDPMKARTPNTPVQAVTGLRLSGHACVTVGPVCPLGHCVKPGRGPPRPSQHQAPGTPRR